MSSGKLASEVRRRGLCLAALLLASSAFAQERGFAVHRYDSTTAGSWLFMVERPWYSGTRYFAIGVTADGAINPLVPALATGRGAATPIISTALLGHIDLAGSLFDRVLLRASIPVTLLERGTSEAVSQASPLNAVALGDPRVGLMVRLFGQTERDPFSLHLGADVWIPIFGASRNEGDRTLRFMPRLVMAGAAGKARWTFDAGFLLRSYSTIGPPTLGMSAASEGRVGFGFGFALLDERLYLGPEVKFSSQVVGANAFAINGMSLEALLGAQVLIAEHLQLGVAAGAGFLGAAGTPDARALVRIAWAPRHASSTPIEPAPVAFAPTGVLDADHDGVPDDPDRCPYEPETWNDIRDDDGCPEYEMPKGSPLTRVLIAEVPFVPDAGTASDAGGPFGFVATTQRDAGFINQPEVRAVEAAKRDAGVTIAERRARYEEMVRNAEVAAATRDGGVNSARSAREEEVAPVKRDAGVNSPGRRVREEEVAAVKRDAGLNNPDRRARDEEVATAKRDAGIVNSDSRPGEESFAAAIAVMNRDAGTVARAVELSANSEFVAAAGEEQDSDDDGVIDEADRCPVQPEDYDGFEDEDGCPELDNDQDAVPDIADRCPLEAETPNGVADDDGCPDTASDADQDWIADVADRCPYEAETYDGIRDDDGCPEFQGPSREELAELIAPPVVTPATALSAEKVEAVLEAGLGDADKDGVLDEADRCPVTPEDADGFEDEDGCPELDNDDDGLADVSDKCPVEAETFNGWVDDDGCPDEHQDLDGDSVVYDADRCPYEPGDATDGCPHIELPKLAIPGFPGAPAPQAVAPAAAETPIASAEPAADLDRDTTEDEADRCPVSAEDADGFEDEDGCPELDNDSDGIPDSKDKCPFEAETINGVKDDDGCPDKGASKVSIEGEHVVIKGVILFTSGSAKLAPSSMPLLKQVASTLKAAKSITVEIQGHTDDVGNAAKNIKLSSQRADTIRKVLIKDGVAENRLISNGYGPTRPVATNKTAKGREKNRRVEFLILGESK